MRYGERDLRAVDVLALLLVGLGILCAVLTALSWSKGPSELASSAGARWAVSSIVLLALGCALNIKLRRVLKRGGAETGANLLEPGDTGETERHRG